MVRRRVSRGVGRRDVRMLEEWFCCCWVVLEVVVGCVGCLGVRPLRLMGADEEEAIGRICCCRCVFLMV